MFDKSIGRNFYLISAAIIACGCGSEPKDSNCGNDSSNSDWMSQSTRSKVIRKLRRSPSGSLTALFNGPRTTTL